MGQNFAILELINPIRDTTSWADLSPPLLDLILECLPFADYLRFPAVCSSWQDVQQDHRLHHATSPRYKRQMPWLIIEGDQASQWVFYNPSEQRYYRISLPADGCYYWVSKYGWFLSERGNSLLLQNIFTGRQMHIPLPPSGTGDYPLCWGHQLSSLPTDPDCSLLYFFNQREQYSFFYFYYQFRNKRWTRLPTDPLNVCPLICNGKFYKLLSEEKLYQVEPLRDVVGTCVDIHVSELVTLDDPDSTVEFFLVECHGQLLLAILISTPPNTYKFQLFKLDPTQQQVWVRLESLGEQTLFISNCGYSFSLSPDDFGGPGNRIYFWERKNNPKFIEYDYESDQVIDNRLMHSIEHQRKHCAMIVPSLC